MTSLPNRLKMDANSTPTAPLPRIAIDFGTSRRPIASSLVMMRLRSMRMPGTLRGADPVATMISLRARSCCASPSKTSTPPLPVSRAVPLIQSILFFLKRNSTPLVRPLTMRSLRDWTCAMSMRMSLVAPIETPHSFAFWTIFNACACSSSALVGMQPHSRQVPPSAFCFSTTATLSPSCAARIAATYPPVPAPITTTSYSFIWKSFSRLRFQAIGDGTNGMNAAGPPRLLGRLRPAVDRSGRAAGRTRSAAPSTTRRPGPGAGRSAAPAAARRRRSAGRPR